MALTFDYMLAASTALRNDPQGRDLDDMWFEVKGYPERDKDDARYPAHIPGRGWTIPETVMFVNVHPKLVDVLPKLNLE